MDIVCYISIFILRISILDRLLGTYSIYIYISIIPVFIYSAITVCHIVSIFLIWFYYESAT